MEIPEDQLINIREIIEYLAALAVGYILRLFQKKKAVEIGESVMKQADENYRRNHPK